MARALAMILALFPGAAAWALCGMVPFEGLVFLGAVSLLGGIWMLGQRVPRDLRFGILAFACVTLLGTTGLRMRAMAAIRPFSAYSELSQKDLVEQTPPVASEGESFLRPSALRPPPADSRDRQVGGLMWRGRGVCMDEIEEILDR